MKQLSRLGIQRMIDTSGSAGSGGSGGNDIISLAGYATEAWVEENYLSIEFFSKLFKAYGPAETSGDPDVEVVPNDVESTISNIKAMFGLWTDEYLSALGLGPDSGGGGGITLNEPLNSINVAGLADHPSASGQTIVWNGTGWAYGNASGNVGVTSVNFSAPTGFTVSGAPITNSGTITLGFATGYGLPLTADVDKGVTAYGWGNHAIAGYALSSNVYSKADADGRFLTISFFRSLFKAYQSNDTTEVVPNNGDTSLISSIKAMFGFWTEQYISALGLGPSGGGGVSLNEPLSSINSAGMSAPTVTGSVLMWNGSSWTYNTQSGTDTKNTAGATNNTAISLYLVGAPSQTANPETYTRTGCYIDANGYLFSGGVKVLTSAVQSIVIGASGTPISPVNGVVTLPAYPSKTSQLTNDSGFITGYTDTKNTAGATDLQSVKLYLIGANGQTANPQTYTNSGCYIDANGYLFSGGVKVLTSAVQSVVIGASGTPISPVNGVVTLPAYPSKTSQLTNDSGFITGYTDTKNTAGTTNNVNTKLFLVGATSQGANPQTYSNSSCYIGSDNCLYSGGSKVQTVASGYLPLSGGTLTNSNDILSLSSSSTNAWIYFKSTVSGTVSNRATVGYYNYFAFIANENTYARIGVADNGNPEYWPGSAGNTRYTLLHSGNYSNYFTNTKNTAGATNNTAISLYLVGAPSQSENPETYTRSGCYISSDGYLYSGGSKVLTSSGGLVTGISVDNSTPYTPTNGIVGLPVLRLSGGTLTNSDNILSLSSSSTNVWIYFRSTFSGTVSTRAAVGYYNYFAFISNENTYARIGVADNGNPEYWPGSAGNTRYTLLHSGNYSNLISVINGTLTAGDLTIGGSATVNSVSCAVIQTNSSRGIYVKTGIAPNYVDGTWSNASDLRLKDIIDYADATVYQIAGAPIFNFKWKSGGNQIMLGTSAQYWRSVFKYAVGEGPNSYLYMDYGSIALASAVITAKKVQDHEMRIQALERENEALKNELSRLKAA